MPSTFVCARQNAVDAHGKIDRRNLPAPDAIRPELKAQFVAPATPVEEALAAIWRGLLGLERVGTADSFFELGGHSLLATQLVSQLREVFKVELPLRALFEAPTIAQLATNLVAREPEPGLVQRGPKSSTSSSACPRRKWNGAIAEQQSVAAS